MDPNCRFMDLSTICLHELGKIAQLSLGEPEPMASCLGPSLQVMFRGSPAYSSAGRGGGKSHSLGPGWSPRRLKLGFVSTWGVFDGNLYRENENKLDELEEFVK